MSPSITVSGPPSTVLNQNKHSHTQRESYIVKDFNLDSHLPEDYVIPDTPLGQRRPLRVVCVGAGYSGIMTAIMVHEKMRDANIDFRIYERHGDIGGTWLVSRYPGCKCDIPAHNYAYSFHPNPKWPNYYATASQIQAYLKDVVDHYEVDQYISLRHLVTQAEWREHRGQWELKVRNSEGLEFTDSCDVLINACGVLSTWKWPSVEGLAHYKGKLMHSAEWDNEYDFAGKKVAVIGIGSSGIQIVPQLAKVVKSMDCYVRTQTWISPAPGINEPTANDPEMDGEYNFAEEVLQEFSDPETLRAYRVAIMDRRIDNFKRVMNGSEPQLKAQELFRKSMRQRLGDTEKGKRIAEQLLPSFPVGCRRQTPGPGYLEALGQPNVELLWDELACVVEGGIRGRDGTVREYDAIVCATGFDTSFRPPFPIVGRDGLDLRAKWEVDKPEAYFGLCVPDVPNYFSYIGPNSPISNGSLVLGIQMTAVYIYKWLEKMQTQNIRSFAVDKIVNEEYNRHMQTYLQRTVWVGGCRSWYKRGTVDGPVVAIYGGTTFHFMEALKNPRWEDFRIDYTTPVNRFAYLGNGFSMREWKGGSVGATQTLDFGSYFDLFVLPDIHG